MAKNPTTNIPALDRILEWPSPTFEQRMKAVAKQEREYRRLEQHAIAAHRKYPVIPAKPKKED